MLCHSFGYITYYLTLYRKYTNKPFLIQYVNNSRLCKSSTGESKIE